MKLILTILWLGGIGVCIAGDALPPSEPTLIAPSSKPAPAPIPKPARATPVPSPKPAAATPVPATPPPTPSPAPPRVVQPPTSGQLLTAMTKRRAILTKDLAKANGAKKSKKKGASETEKSVASAAEITQLEVHSFYLRHREHVLLQQGFTPEPLGKTPILFDELGVPYWIDGYGAWRYDFSK